MLAYKVLIGKILVSVQQFSDRKKFLPYGHNKGHKKLYGLVHYVLKQANH